MGSQDPYLLMETKIDISAIYSQIKKDVGMEDPKPVPYVIPTGSISLDRALKIGGYPAGRVTELVGMEHGGKTTLAMSACVQAQKMGLPFGYIDNENTLDYDYFKAMGVKGEANKDWIHLTPETGEDTWRALEMLVDKGIKLIVVDSVSAMTPKAEIEGDYGESNMGLQARMMGQGFRKTISKIAQNEVCVIFINQIRMKIGVMFGCMVDRARVIDSNGRSVKIGKLVNQRLPLEVKSLNLNTMRVENKPIIDYHKNGLYENHVQIEVEGRRFLHIADCHTLITPSGEVLSTQLKVGDEVYVRGRGFLTPDREPYILGMLLGDGSIRKRDGVAELRVEHGVDQAEYAQWKSSLLYGTTQIKDRGFSLRSGELIPYLSLGCKQGRIVGDWVNKFTLQTLAIWYMDDGSFDKDRERCYIACKGLIDKENLTHTIERLTTSKPTFDNRAIRFNSNETAIFLEKIAPYCAPCMSYKLGIYSSLIQDQFYKGEEYETVYPRKIVAIKNGYNGRSRVKFDISVEGNANYFVDDVLVHNSPETTSGGKALPFFASIRLDIRQVGDAIEEKGEQIGKYSKVKVIKNKCAVPNGVAMIPIIWGQGIDRASELFDEMLAKGVIGKSGSFYTYKDVKLNGKANMIAYIDGAMEEFEKYLEKKNGKNGSEEE